MTREMEKEIDSLYEFLKITPMDNTETDKENGNTDTERTSDFFEKRWDSSFFSTAMRY